ncbi:alpha/beta fold hydrolase [Spirabiliibacterium falconis]|uniref:alpha/beta fold hydrolase n=1 Tax=Spirabiliibacterium falconis TaxID=572023 RepID=UPI001AAD3A98|nr:alpha/beta hydrolase [Spirabiliibacterium falconis]MBE2894442.1 alpha/beta hydrolase [Spirabiliibacterium falconis]
MQQREPHFAHFVLTTLSRFIADFPLQFLQGRQGCRIAYRFFRHDNDDCRRLMVLVSGRGGNMLKWSEVAYDFYHHGFDVLLFDHRGQGYSQRLLPEHEKGYVDQFDYYLYDLDAVIHTIAGLENYQHKVMLGHSLGGLIATHYLARYPHTFDQLVLTAPLFGLPLKHGMLDRVLINLAVLFGLGRRYIPGKTDYRPVNINNNDLSACKTRMKWVNRLARRFPKLTIGGPTFAWVHQCLNYMQQLPRAAKKIAIPVLIIQAEKDSIVCNHVISHSVPLFSDCQSTIIAHAKHELLFERDHIRHNVLNSIYRFLE